MRIGENQRKISAVASASQLAEKITDLKLWSFWTSAFYERYCKRRKKTKILRVRVEKNRNWIWNLAGFLSTKHETEIRFRFWKSNSLLFHFSRILPSFFETIWVHSTFKHEEESCRGDLTKRCLHSFNLSLINVNYMHVLDDRYRRPSR